MALNTTFTLSRPVVVWPIPDQTATEGRSFRFRIPPGTFIDPRAPSLFYSVAVIGASAPWLHFNTGSLTFSGTVPRGAPDVQIRVRARNHLGRWAEDQFVLRTPAGRRAASVADRTAMALADAGDRPLASAPAGLRSALVDQSVDTPLLRCRT